MMLRSLILILAILPTFAAENIKTVGAVSKANIKAVGAVAEANLKAIGAVDSTGGGGGSATYLVKQGFEGAGYDNSETWSEEDGSPDEDYTGVVLDGSQSLRINTSASAAYTSTTFVDQDEIWVYLKLRLVGSLPSDTMALFSGIQAFSGVSGVQILSNGKLRVSHAGPLADTVDALSPDTTYHVWFYFLKGTGANGLASVGFSTDGTKPTSGDKFASVPDGAGTDDIEKLRVGPTGSTTVDLITDKWRVDDAEIGSNPE